MGSNDFLGRKALDLRGRFETDVFSLENSSRAVLGAKAEGCSVHLVRCAVFGNVE